MLTQAQFVEEVASDLGDTSRLSEKGLVKKVLETVRQIAVGQLGTEHQTTIPILGLKLVLLKRGPTKARKGRNPATGEEIMISAKPASKQLKARVLKSLKDEVL